jgi:hypothetical protein
MNFKLMAAVLAVAVVPVCVEAQAPNPPKTSKPAKAAPAPAAPVTTATAAQKVVKVISGDKVKTQTYCDIGKLGSEIESAEKKQDMQKIDELNKRMDGMVTKLGPEYVALVARLEDIDPNSKEALEIDSVLETLDKLCAK